MKKLTEYRVSLRLVLESDCVLQPVLSQDGNKQPLLAALELQSCSSISSLLGTLCKFYKI